MEYKGIVIPQMKNWIKSLHYYSKLNSYGEKSSS